MAENTTMLAFTGDSERLRQVAKAHAAGDIDQEDYRQIRTAVLESLDGGAADEAVGPASAGVADTGAAAGEGTWQGSELNDQPGQLLVLVAAGAAAVLALVAGMLLAG